MGLKVDDFDLLIGNGMNLQLALKAFFLMIGIRRVYACECLWMKILSVGYKIADKIG